MRKGWRPSAVIFFKTGPNAFLLIAVAGLKSEKTAVWHCSVRTSPDTPDEHLSGYLICHAISVHGRWECAADRSPSLRHTRDAPDQSQCHGPQGRNPLGKISSEKNSCIWTLHPFWKSTSLTLFRLHRSSISVIFSVSRSSWSFKSVTVRLSSRAATWTESTRSTCLLRLGNYGLKLLS